MDDFKYISFGPFPDDEKIRDLEKIPNLIIVNCTTEKDLKTYQLTEYKTSLEILKYPINEYSEPNDEKAFTVFVKALVELVENGAKLFVHSIEGGGRAAFVTLCVICIYENQYVETIVPYLTEEYETWNNTNPYFNLTEVPRNVKQLAIAVIISKEITWDNMYRKNNDRIISSSNRKYSRNIHGRIKTEWTNIYDSLENKKWPYLFGYKSISLSWSRHEWTNLSSHYMGPFMVDYIDWKGDKEVVEVNNFRNLWWGTKVYENWIGKDGNPTADYYRARWSIWTSEFPMKYDKYELNNNVKYHWWRGEKISVEIARLAIFCNIYEQQVITKKTYKELRLMYKNGYDILLMDEYGFDCDELGIGFREGLCDLKRLISDSMVLYGLLTGRTIWHSYKNKYNIDIKLQLNSELMC